MIAFLRGTLEEWSDDAVVVDVHGVGYDVCVPRKFIGSLPPVGQPLSLFTRDYVRENEHVLFGFQTREERRIFDLMLGVNGVGPRLALNLLSVLSPEQFLTAVQEGNAARIAVVPGIGKKTAQRIVLELQGRVGAPQSLLLAGAQQSGTVGEAIRALMALGADELNAEAAVLEAQRSLDEGVPLEELIKGALRSLHP
jgi:Holliday junction DNA helicase RuvA